MRLLSGKPTAGVLDSHAGCGGTRAPLCLAGWAQVHVRVVRDEAEGLVQRERGVVPRDRLEVRRAGPERRRPLQEGRDDGCADALATAGGVDLDRREPDPVVGDDTAADTSRSKCPSIRSTTDSVKSCCRYSIDATSDSPSRRISSVRSNGDAPFDSSM